jgi:hypothetical protein
VPDPREEENVHRASIALMIAIVVLGAGGVALVARWTPEWRSARRSAGIPGTGGPAAAAAPAPSPARTRVPVDAARPPGTDPRGEATRTARVERAAREGAPAATRAPVVSFRREMKAGFAALQRRVARCGAEDAWFTLDVETVAGGVRVVEARVEFPGSAGEAGIACARSILVGETIAAPSAPPGRRWQVSFAPGSKL